MESTKSKLPAEAPESLDPSTSLRERDTTGWRGSGAVACLVEGLAHRSVDTC